MSGKQTKQVLITVAHGECKESKITLRKCDKMAFEMGSLLKKKFEEKEILPYFYANTGIPLYETDMNKFEARNSHFRTDLRNVMRYLTTTMSKVYVFDMHSFPGKGLYPIYILVSQTQQLINEAISLASFLSDNLKFKIGVYSAGLDSDIIMEAYQTIPNVTPFVVSVSEIINKEILDKLLDKIPEWVLTQTK